MKRVAFLMFVLALLAPQVLGASYEQPKRPKEKPPKESTQIIPVPEAATITLLGAAAGAVVVRKWRNRQR